MEIQEALNSIKELRFIEGEKEEILVLVFANMSTATLYAGILEEYFDKKMLHIELRRHNAGMQITFELRGVIPPIMPVSAVNIRFDNESLEIWLNQLNMYQRPTRLVSGAYNNEEKLRFSTANGTSWEYTITGLVITK